MPSDGLGTSWDVTIPTDSGEVSDTGLEMREIKKAVEIRLNKEHVVFDDNSVGGEHRAGSAFAYYQDSYPTLRADGVSNLDSTDAGRLLVRSGVGEGWTEYWDGSAWQKVRQADSNVNAAQLASGIFDDICSLAVYVNQLGSTDTHEVAGTFTSGAWRTRVLNTEILDAKGIGALATNQITLAAGTYRIRAKAPALQVDYHQVRFFNITESATVEYGNMALSGASDTTQTYSEVVTEFTIGSTKVFELQHRCATTKSGTGTGAGPGSFGTQWYTAVVEIYKIK